MKKIFLFVLMLFAFAACSNTQFVHDVQPISKSEKTVLIQYFPSDFEIPLEKALEDNFWKVSVVANKDSASPSVKSNIAVTCDGLYLAHFGTYQGTIKFSDLRTGKRIAIYKFNMATRGAIIENIVKTLAALPGASNTIPATSTTSTQAVK